MFSSLGFIQSKAQYEQHAKGASFKYVHCPNKTLAEISGGNILRCIYKKEENKIA